MIADQVITILANHPMGESGITVIQMASGKNHPIRTRIRNHEDNWVVTDNYIVTFDHTKEILKLENISRRYNIFGVQEDEGITYTTYDMIEQITFFPVSTNREYTKDKDIFVVS